MKRTHTYEGYMPVKTKLNLLDITITFDLFYTSADVGQYRTQLLEQLASLPPHLLIANDDREKEKQLICDLAEKRLQLLDRYKKPLDQALEVINKFKINYGKAKSSKAVNETRLAQLRTFENVIVQINPTLYEWYNALEVSNEHPEISTAITKKLYQINKLAKKRTMELLDSLSPTAEQDAQRYRLTKNDMDMLIANKQQKREINGHVIDGNNPCSVTSFLENILKNGQKRTQLVYKITGTEHWSVLDIQRNENDTLSIFFLDSVGLTTNLPKIEEFCSKHQIELTLAMGGLQKDFSSCSIFSIDHVFKLSKIADLHEQLRELRTPKPNSQNTFEVNPMDLPPELVKNAQSSTYIKSYLQKHQEYETTKINKKNQTLFAYAEAHQVQVDNQQINRAINYKQSQYRNKINQIKGYKETQHSHSNIINNAQQTIAQATQEVIDIKLNIQSDSMNGAAFYFQTLLQQIEEIRTARPVRDAQTILNLRQPPALLTRAIADKQNELIDIILDSMDRLHEQETNSGADSSLIKSSEAIALQNRYQTLIAISFNEHLTLLKDKTKLLAESSTDKTDPLLLKIRELYASLDQLKRSFLLEKPDISLEKSKTDFIQQYRTILQTAKLALNGNNDWEELINTLLNTTKPRISPVALQSQLSLFANTGSPLANLIKSESTNKLISQSALEEPFRDKATIDNCSYMNILDSYTISLGLITAITGATIIATGAGVIPGAVILALGTGILAVGISLFSQELQARKVQLSFLEKSDESAQSLTMATP